MESTLSPLSKNNLSANNPVNLLPISKLFRPLRDPRTGLLLSERDNDAHEENMKDTLSVNDSIIEDSDNSIDHAKESTKVIDSLQKISSPFNCSNARRIRQIQPESESDYDEEINENFTEISSTKLSVPSKPIDTEYSLQINQIESNNTNSDILSLGHSTDAADMNCDKQDFSQNSIQDPQIPFTTNKYVEMEEKSTDEVMSIPTIVDHENLSLSVRDRIKSRNITFFDTESEYDCLESDLSLNSETSTAMKKNHNQTTFTNMAYIQHVQSGESDSEHEKEYQVNEGDNITLSISYKNGKLGAAFLSKGNMTLWLMEDMGENENWDALKSYPLLPENFSVSEFLYEKGKSRLMNLKIKQMNVNLQMGDDISCNGTYLWLCGIVDLNCREMVGAAGALLNYLAKARFEGTMRHSLMEDLDFNVAWNPDHMISDEGRITDVKSFLLSD
ncbi:hypothetical protein HK096_004749 [Nowakowskiella sp. JEL0078]|nr:hypothetical protein HK096_004749 [Nowakowskiella sp. JEL0078]